MRRLDGVLPTAFEGLQQRRETIKKLQEIDKLLRDDPDSAPRIATTRGCSFGSGRQPTKNPRYWLSKGSTVPGPGAYVVSKADRLIKPNTGGAGAVGLRSGVCCRFQRLCECKSPREERAENILEEAYEKRQDTKQPRRSSPPLVAYSRRSDTEPDFQTREQQRRVAVVQASKQRWKHLGSNTTPNYRLTERRVGAGGALPMNKTASRDGTGNSAAKARLRKLLISGQKAQKCEVETSRPAKTTTTRAMLESKTISGSFMEMTKLSGRDTVRCRRKDHRIVITFGR